MGKYKKYTSKEDALKKLMRYCAYQDRCHREVTHKLLDLGIYGEDHDEIVLYLIQEGFLNEERFAKSFARGKFRFKKWGRKKIIQALQQRDISPYLIKEAMKEIEEADYTDTLYHLAKRHLGQSKDYAHRTKTFRYLYNKGYESSLIQQTLDRLISPGK